MRACRVRLRLLACGSEFARSSRKFWVSDLSARAGGGPCPKTESEEDAASVGPNKRSALRRLVTSTADRGGPCRQVSAFSPEKAQCAALIAPHPFAASGRHRL